MTVRGVESFARHARCESTSCQHVFLSSRFCVCLDAARIQAWPCGRCCPANHVFVECFGLGVDAMEQQRQIQEAERECSVELERIPLQRFGRLVGNLTLGYLALDFSESQSIFTPR